MSVLDRADGVRADYRHVGKLVRPRPVLTLGDIVLKWYDVAPAESPVPSEIRRLARDGLREASASGTLGIAGGLGFVVLHRCGESFYFLLVSTWRNDNELWETVLAKDGDDPAFRRWPVEGTHRPTFCVWELGAVCHEQLAWSRYLRSRRDEGAKQAYLQSAYEGPV
ncbi:MAG TPA: hypothetical protein VFR63_05860 [Gaiellaceae bacterium]|jgi:hypothetical protein|nr:hypothetical protein [Gaiellaceae bacterium]